MRRAHEIAVVASFSAVITASNFALTGALNVKLLDTLVFAAAFVFGFRTGALVAVVSELVWGTVSPFGFGGYIIPLLVAGELIYAGAGALSSRVWRADLRPLSLRNFALGSVLATCAFLWDLATNLGTALIVQWPSLTLQGILAVQGFGVPFMVLHELSDFFLGALAAPPIIIYLLSPALARLRPAGKPELMVRQ